jgi:RNA polymerase sigma-70 factor (ECF subfamily)
MEKGPEMITQALEGEDAARLVAQLFDHYSDAIFAYLYRLVGNREVAEELAQESFLRAYNARRRLMQAANQRAWLYRVATNAAFDHLRRGRRFAWLPWSSLDELRAPQPDVADAANQRDALEHAFQALPVDYRAPLLLHCYDGLSVAEVADALGISEGAVKMRLRRAREMFRRAYNPEAYQREKQNGGLL